MLKNGKKALVPFLTAGYPSMAASLAYMRAAADAGADAIEIGIPFSDPLADGPVIQEASQSALDHGTTMEDAFELARRFRARHDTPLFFMTYANPVARLGPGKFFMRCRDIGLSGVIVPDLPPEESGEFEEHGFPLVFLCSPTCRSGRVRTISAKSEPFVYLVALKGVTGARETLPADLSSFVKRVRRTTKKPLFVGFGISLPEQARKVARLADGVIIGSAILRRVASGDKPAQIGRYLTSIRNALDRS